MPEAAVSPWMSQVNETNPPPCVRTPGYPTHARCHSRQNISQYNTWIEAMETTWEGHRSCASPEEERAVCAPSECSCMLSCAWFCDSMTVACQAPLSMGFPRQEYWSGLPFPPLGCLPNSGMEPSSPAFPALAGEVFTSEPPGKHTLRHIRAKEAADISAVFSQIWEILLQQIEFLPIRRRATGSVKGCVWSVRKKDMERGTCFSRSVMSDSLWPNGL